MYLRHNQDMSREIDIMCNFVYLGTEREGWQKIKGRFVAINGFVMSCKCGKAPEGTASSAHLGDGCMDLVLIHECTRVDYASHLLRTIDKKADQVSIMYTGRLRQPFTLNYRQKGRSGQRYYCQILYKDRSNSGKMCNFTPHPN